MLPADSSILSPIPHVSKQLYFENEILQYKKVCPLILMKITHLAQLCTDAPSPLSNPELLFLTSYRTVGFSLTSAERLCLRFLQTRMRGVRWFSLLHLKKKETEETRFSFTWKKVICQIFPFPSARRLSWRHKGARKGPAGAEIPTAYSRPGQRLLSGWHTSWHCALQQQWQGWDSVTQSKSRWHEEGAGCWAPTAPCYTGAT